MFVRLQPSHAPVVYGEQIGINVWTWLNRPLGTATDSTGAASRDVTWPLEQPRHSLHQVATSEEQHLFQTKRDKMRWQVASVADPDPNPDPPDPNVFGPPGSGSTSQRYGSGSGSCSGSGSGSFYHHAKIVRKTLIPTILWLFLTFYLWKWCKCSFKK